VVRQTPEVHQQIGQLLWHLHAARPVSFGKGMTNGPMSGMPSYDMNQRNCLPANLGGITFGNGGGGVFGTNSGVFGTPAPKGEVPPTGGFLGDVK